MFRKEKNGKANPRPVLHAKQPALSQPDVSVDWILFSFFVMSFYPNIAHFRSTLPCPLHNPRRPSDVTKSATNVDEEEEREVFI